MKYLIKNGSIIDPARRVATVGNVLVADGKVVQLFELADMYAEREAVGDDVEIINARGCVVAPGFTDLHTHLREPGEEHKETIASGTLAAARGGFTTVCAMPDTDPPNDRAAVARQVRQIARREAHVHVEVIGALSMGREGRSLSEMQELVGAGVIAFGDGRPIENPLIMRNGLAYAGALGVPVMAHCEDPRLNAGWAMHEGVTSTRLGLPGYPAAAEESIIARDITLVEGSDAHLHICHVSTAGGVELIRAAKLRGVRVTAEVTPHHLTLTERWVLGALARSPSADPQADTQPQVRLASRRKRNHNPELGLPSWLNPALLPPYDPSTRLNPPLRTDEDLAALIEGLRDGTIDAIATDHTPQALVDKACEYGLAEPGISSLETTLGLVLTLVHRGELDLVNMVAKLTEGPAGVLGRSPATLRPGARADIVIFDPDRLWMVDSASFISRGRSSPLQNQQLKGQVMLTMAAGRIVFRRDNFGKSSSSPSPQHSRLEGILFEEE